MPLIVFITMSTQPHSDNSRILFLMLICLRQKDAKSLFKFFPPEQVQYFEKTMSGLAQRREQEIRAVARAELKRCVRERERSVLGDIHDDWIVDRLSQETPAMISLLLRHMPAERVGRIVEALPPRKIKSLPRLTETFSVVPALMQAVQHHFEQEFRKRIEAGQGDDPIYLAHLGLAQILQVFMELGYREIALALTSVPTIARERVLGRISKQSRQRVLLYLPQVANVSNGRLKRAQIHLVSKEIDAADQDTFVRELGLTVFGKALLMKEMPQLDRILLRFSKRDAGLIKAMILPHMEHNNEALALAFREEVRQVVQVHFHS